MSYDMIDRFLRNNLGDDDYAKYSAALDSLCAPPQPQEAAPHKPLTEEQISLIREMRDVQGCDGNWNYDPYMQGLYNGLECAVSLLEKREPVFRYAPEQWLGDISKKRDNFNIVGSKTAAHGIKGEA